MAKKTSEVKRITESAELLAKSLLLITGGCYVLGLIVVNIHLSQYAVYSLSLLQLNYVTAGMWSLLPILLAVIVLSLAFSGRKQFVLFADPRADSGPFSAPPESDDKAKCPDAVNPSRKVADEASGANELRTDVGELQASVKGRADESRSSSESEYAGKRAKLTRFRRLANWVLPPVFAAAGALICIFWALRLLAGYVNFTFGWNWLWALLLGGPAFFALLLCLFGWLRIAKRAASSTLRELADAVIATSLAIGLFLLYMVVFARGPYKEIPSGLGGGRPDEVRFIVDIASKPYLEAERLLQFTGDSSTSEPLELILATDREYVFISAGVAVSIRNESVKAVLHQKK